MPYPNFHSARIREPNDFVHIKVLKTLDNGIMIYGGPLKSDPDGDTKPQAYRFPKDKFSVAEAKAWLKEHKIKYIKFEAASDEKKSEDVPVERRFIEPLEMQVEKRTDEPVLLRGYAAVFNKLSQPLGFSHYRERIAPGAFTETIKNDDIRALVDHERGRIIGRNVAGTLRLKEDKKGLRYEVDLPSTSVGQDIAISVERGDVSGSSFGFITLSDEWKTEDGEEVRTIGKVKLVDVSPCTFPAYPDTSVAMRSLEQWRQTQQPGYGRELLRGKLTILEAEQSMLEE